MTTRFDPRRAARAAVRIAATVAIATAGATTIAAPAHAGQVGVTPTIYGAGTVSVVEGSIEDDGWRTCESLEARTSHDSLQCPRIRNEEPFEAWVWLRPTPASSDWRFVTWNDCDRERTVDGVVECAVHSSAFGTVERAPRVTFADQVGPDAPELSLTPSTTAISAAVVSLRSAPDVVAHECRVDGGPWFACRDGGQLPLAEGRRSIDARGEDPSGNRGTIASGRIDIVETRIVSGPAAVDAERNPTLRVTSGHAGDYVCTLDGRDLGRCATPGDPFVRLSGLSEGRHVLTVAGRQALGTDGTPARWEWTTDSVAPITQITSAHVDGGEAHVAFEAPEAVSFECTLIGPSGHEPRSCTSPVDYRDLQPGDYRLEVVAFDQAGNREQAPARHDWTVEKPASPAPDTRLEGAPRDGSVVTATTISMRARSADAGDFECALNDRPVACPDGRVSLSGLRAGGYRFEATAVSSDGTLDPTPATVYFDVPHDARSLTAGKGFRVVRDKGAFHGAALVAQRRGASASLRVEGVVSARLLVHRGRGQGTVRVMVGSTEIDTVRLAGTGRARRVVVDLPQLQRPVTGKLRLVSTTGKPVRIEGVVPVMAV